jgi:hypothetical protein
MSYYHLRNQKNPTQNLRLTSSAWRWTLEVAEQSGWNPMGTIHQNLLTGLSMGPFDDLFDMQPGNGTYTPLTSRLVMLEDALNLMDALEQAFLDYEPAPVCSCRSAFRTEWDDWKERARPGVGILLALADFCRYGSFWIENMD